MRYSFLVIASILTGVLSLSCTTSNQRHVASEFFHSASAPAAKVTFDLPLDANTTAICTHASGVGSHASKNAFYALDLATEYADPAAIIRASADGTAYVFGSDVSGIPCSGDSKIKCELCAEPPGTPANAEPSTCGQSWGNHIRILHANGYVSFYAHLDRPLVATGALVHKGDPIGIEGWTGAAGHRHVHWSVQAPNGTTQAEWVKHISWAGESVPFEFSARQDARVQKFNTATLQCAHANIGQVPPEQQPRFSGVPGAQFSVVSVQSDENFLRNRLEQIRASRGAPAVAALLFQNDKVIESAAVGLRKIGDPTSVTVTDKFHLGSDTKAMTATLAAMFVDDGKLSWTSTLADLFPELTQMNADFRKVTLEMLLAHRSGITGDLAKFGDGSLWKKILSPTLDPVAGRRMLVKEILSEAPASQPGSKYEYSNQNYAIVGAILERIAGKSWEKLIAERLFKPLGMNSCGIGALGDPKASQPADPWAHAQSAEGLKPIYLDNPGTIGPAGSVHCSMQDWLKFVRLHLDAFNGAPRLVSATSFAKLHTSYPGQDYTYGGWNKTSRAWAGGVVFTHDGSNTLNYATVWWAPNKKLIAMAVSNVGAPRGQEATTDALVELLLKDAK